MNSNFARTICCFSFFFSLLTLTNNDRALDIGYAFGGGYKPEMFFGRNIHFLNNNNDTDQIWFARHTLDSNIDVFLGKETLGHTAIEFMFTLRNKAVWGNKNSIAQTTSTETKILDVVSSPHKHYIPRHFLWMREAWLRLILNDILSLSFDNEHSFTVGYFPFQLGRGISLGAAFAVGPEVLGFYSDSSIDQFAPGAKLSGTLIQDTLSYDLYWEVMRNRSSSITETEAKILGQQFGHLSSPQRGFGKVDQLFAGRVIWSPLSSDSAAIIIEPYWLFNNDPEQKIEFLGDASSKLGTLGIACDYMSNNVECGFEYALNLGCQKVKGWDRNSIIHQNRNGGLVSVNSHVVLGVDPLSTTITDLAPYKAPHAPIVITNGQQLSQVGKQAQSIINERSFEDESQNGKQIGVVAGISSDLDAIVPCINGAGTVCDTLYNAINRFRNPYCNIYKGWMCVADIAWWMFNRDLKCALAVGVASGDDNPNFETKDGDYAGFIPLQSIYSGKQVRSAFLLGGAGKLKRPLAEPTTDQAPNRFSQSLDGFTNLAFIGAGCKWIPCAYEKRFSFNPNVLAYWQEHSTPAYDCFKQMEISHKCARSFLGIEANMFFNYNIYEQLNFYVVTSIFIPGGHFDDIKGKPLNADQLKRLNVFNRTGVSIDQLPNIGNDIAYTYNCGLEFKF